MVEKITLGISDELFERANVPITKEEIRVISISKMNLRTNSVVWDIGCGTGSISVEIGRICPKCRIYAFDKNTEAIELTKRNLKKFNVTNVEVVHGIAPEVLKSYENPDVVFIGGSEGKMKEILEYVMQKLKPYGTVVLNCITFDCMKNAVEFFKENNLECEVTFISISKFDKVAEHLMLRPKTDVFILNATKNVCEE